MGCQNTSGIRRCARSSSTRWRRAVKSTVTMGLRASARPLTLTIELPASPCVGSRFIYIINETAYRANYNCRGDRKSPELKLISTRTEVHHSKFIRKSQERLDLLLTSPSFV